MRAFPLSSAGDPVFSDGLKVDVKRQGSTTLTKGAAIVSQEGGKFTVSIAVAGREVNEVLQGVDSKALQAPAETYKAGPIHECLIGHSKGTKQILKERDVIVAGRKLKGACDQG